MARVTTDDLLAAINALGKEEPKRPVGDGWKTIRQLATDAGVNISAMRYRFSTAIAKGLKYDRFTGSDFDATGRLVKQTWFRVRR